MPVIDVHTHMTTRSYIELLRTHGGPELELKKTKAGQDTVYYRGSPFFTLFEPMWDYELRIKDMDEAKVDVAIVSLTCPNAYWGGREVALKAAQLVNDSMGHHVGDELLVTVARRLETCIRTGDVVARLGGDEFAILLERVEDARDGMMVVERVQQALSVPFNIGGYDHVSSASIGVALSSGANAQPEYLLRSADIAMYRAKNSGRGRYEIFDRTMHAEALTRLQIESDLRSPSSLWSTNSHITWNSIRASPPGE